MKEVFRKRPLSAAVLCYIVLLCILRLLRPEEIPFTENVPALPSDGSRIRICGEVRDIDLTDEGLRVTLGGIQFLEPELPFPGGWSAFFSTDALSLEVGNLLWLNGTCGWLPEASNPGQFDAGAYYRSQKTAFMIRDPHLISCSRQDARSLSVRMLLRRYLYRVRWKMVLSGRLLFGEASGDALAAVLLGQRTLMDAGQKLLYQEGGLAHMFAISGLHISLAGMGVYVLLRRMRAGRIPGGLCSLALLFLYIEMTGWSASSMRAYIMFLLWIVARMTGRAADSLTSLAAAALWILILRPGFLTQSGFQLSFLAILVLNTLVPLCRDTCSVRSRTGQALLAGLCLQAGMLPGMLYYYYQFTPWSVLVNLLVLPVMSMVMLSGAAASLLYFISPAAAGFFCAPCHYLLRAMQLLCELELQLPFAVWVRGRPSRTRLLGYVLLLTVTGVILRRLPKRIQAVKGGRWIPAGIWLCAFAAGVLFLHAPSVSGLEVTCLDVGQGDGILIRIPDGSTMVVDGGSSSSGQIWKYCLEPALKYYGIRDIDWWFVTHTDTDHISALEEYLEAYTQNRSGKNIHGITLRNLAFPVTDDTDAAKEKLTLAAMKYGISSTVLCRNDILSPAGSLGGEEQRNRLSADSSLEGEEQRNRLSADSSRKKEEQGSTGYRTETVLQKESDADEMSGRDLQVPGMNRSPLTSGEGMAMDWSLQVLAPDPAHLIGDKNQDNLVLMLQYRSFHMLLTGDLEKDGEAYLADQKVRLQADVLKVGHHGSKNATSEPFLERVCPQAAIISCSAANSYGHPAVETLERLKEAGCRTWITKDCGAVAVQTDGRVFRIEPWKKESGSQPLSCGHEGAVAASPPHATDLPRMRASVAAYAALVCG